MYSEKDMAEINGRIRRNWLALGPVLALLLAAYIYGLAARVKWVAMAAGPLLFVAACYGVLAYLWPNTRYRRFLRDMQAGLSRDVSGTILSVGETREMQDGAWVLPVRVALDADEAAEAHLSSLAERLEAEDGEDTRNERIVYLNTSKREGFPGPGAHVALRCFGRHIKSVE